MAQNKRINVGPIALTNTLTTNILNPPTATGGVNAGSSNNYILIYQMHITNKTAGAVTYTLYKGATGGNAAGTELAVGVSVPANSSTQLYWQNGLRFDTADFLVGGASANTSLVITMTGEIGVAG